MPDNKASRAALRATRRILNVLALLLRLTQLAEEALVGALRHSDLFVTQVQNAIRLVLDQFEDRLVVDERHVNEVDSFVFVELQTIPTPQVFKTIHRQARGKT